MAKNSCLGCAYYRPYKPMSQLVAKELGTADGTLLTELIKMMQDEKQKKDEEAELVVRLMGDRTEQWGYKPQMTDFCGLYEHQQVFLVHQLKNPDGDCPDFDVPSGPERTCANCIHARRGNGDARDNQRIKELIALQTNAAAVGQSGSSDSAIDRFTQLIGSRKSFESLQSYYAGKVSNQQPEYLSYCEAYSSRDNYVPCVVQNPHNSCYKWTDGKKQVYPPKPPSIANPLTSIRNAATDADITRDLKALKNKK
jgi:hypothetical protein